MILVANLITADIVLEIWSKSEISHELIYEMEDLCINYV
jgi:hypothetical protein